MILGAIDGLNLKSRRVLHAGCAGAPLPDWLPGVETRLDIDPQWGPDIVANVTELGDIGPFDVVYTSHTLEHLYPHDVRKALGEFFRVLAPGGLAIMVVPDLEEVRPTLEPLYESPAGWITGLDMFYGCARLVETNSHMAHRCGFVSDTLKSVMEAAGFANLHMLRLNHYSLLGGGRKP